MSEKNAIKRTRRQSLLAVLLSLAAEAADLFVSVWKPAVVGVKVMLVREEEVLLVRHVYKSGWYLPGGGVRRGESVAAAAAREAREEVGAELGSLELFGLYSRTKNINNHLIVLLCREFTLSGETDHEIEAAEFFSVAQPPPDATPATRRRLAEYCRPDRQPAPGVWE